MKKFIIDYVKSESLDLHLTNIIHLCNTELLKKKGTQSSASGSGDKDRHSAISESQTPDEGASSAALLEEVIGEDVDDMDEDPGDEEDQNSNADSQDAMSIDGDERSDVTVETPPRPPELLVS